MATINLTTEWQTVDSAVWDFGATKVTLYLDAKYSEQSQPNNTTTTFQTRLRSVLNYGYGSGYGYKFTCSFTNTIEGSNEWYLATETITEGQATVAHLPNGEYNTTITATASVNGLGVSSNLSGTIIMPTIKRASTLNSISTVIANNGQSISITPRITKNVNNCYDVLYIFDVNTGPIWTQENAIDNTTYTITNQTIINQIYERIGTSTSKGLPFASYVVTYTDSTKTTYLGTSNTGYPVFTLPNYTISTTVTMAETVTSLNAYKPNGHANDTFIANLSKPQFTLTTTSSTGSFYGRSVTYKLNNNIITSPYTENSYTGQNFTFNVTDGRKNISVTPSFTNIAYFKPTLTTTIKRTSPTGSTADITVSGTLYDGTGLTGLAIPKLDFKYTESGGGTEQTIQIPLTITGSNFTGSTQISGLNYKKSLTWSSILTDRLGITANNGNTLPQGLPVYHAYRKNDENYFNIYGNAIANTYNGYELDLNTNNTTDSWVPVLKNDKIQYRVIPTTYNSTKPSLDGFRMKVDTNGFDANNLTDSGFYQVAVSLATYSNLPSGFNYGVLIVLSQVNGTDGAFQTLQLGFSSTNNFWYRTRTNSVWQSWKLVNASSV